MNLGFLLGLAVVTSTILPDHQNEALSSETVIKPTKTKDHGAKGAVMRSMPQLKLVAIPQPSADIQVEAKKHETPLQRAKTPTQSKAPSKAKSASVVQKTKMSKRTVTPMTLQRVELAAVKHRPNLNPLSQPQDLKSATRVAQITPLKPKTKPSVAANKAASSLKEDVVTKELTQASLNPLSLETLAKKIERPTMSPPLDIVIEVARPTISDLAIARQQLNKGEEAPSIEFLWPSDRNDHHLIYNSLTNCLGMTVGHVSNGGKVTIADGQSAKNYSRQIFSPMLRSLNEPSTPAEANLIKALSSQMGTGQLVRIFRKETDAKILAGLLSLMGVSGPVTGSITAEYLLSPRGLYLADITHNRKSISGRIELLKGRCG